MLVRLDTFLDFHRTLQAHELVQLILVIASVAVSYGSIESCTLPAALNRWLLKPIDLQDAVMIDEFLKIDWGSGELWLQRSALPAVGSHWVTYYCTWRHEKRVLVSKSFWVRHRSLDLKLDLLHFVSSWSSRCLRLLADRLLLRRLFRLAMLLKQQVVADFHVWGWVSRSWKHTLILQLR